MALPAKPTGPYKWADSLLNNGPLGGPNRIDPPIDKQDAGWAWGAKPSFDEINGVLYNIYKSLEWSTTSIETLDAQIGTVGQVFGIDENDMSTVSFPSGGTYSTTGSPTGAIEIKLPQSWSDTRLKFLVDIFDKTTGLSSSILISGFNVTGSDEWQDTSALTVAGNRSLRVRFGHDGSTCVVVIGETTDTFVSPHVRVRDFTGHGGSLWQFTNWVSGWQISSIASVVGITFTGTDLTAAPSGLPVGTSITFNTSTVPDSFLEEDGSAVSRTTYADLFAVLGTTFGIGDGATTFNLPDKRGEFLRGWDNGAGNDPDAVTRTDRGDGTTGDFVGTKQDGEVGPHVHSGWNSSANGPTGGGTNWGRPGDTDANTGSETRPRNINVMYCIKY